MNDKINAILISESDDVATSIVEFHRGDSGCFRKRGEMIQVRIVEEIPKFHKFAVRDIRRGDFVRKYGEIIGEAVQDVGRGCYVHDHNLVSPKQAEMKAGSE